jgi:hypothetical protein
MSFLIIIALLTGLYGLDYIISKSYQIEIVSVMPSSAIPADGKTIVAIKIRLTRNGKTVENHKMVAIPKGGGSFKNSKIVTDRNGEAIFLYTPYLASDYVEAVPTNIQIYDDSNSLFISVPTRIVLTLDLITPETSEDNSTNDGMF